MVGYRKTLGVKVLAKSKYLIERNYNSLDLGRMLFEISVMIKVHRRDQYQPDQPK